jgi:hypothetical protein
MERRWKGDGKMEKTERGFKKPTGPHRRQRRKIERDGGA